MGAIIKDENSLAAAIQNHTGNQANALEAFRVGVVGILPVQLRAFHKQCPRILFESVIGASDWRSAHCIVIAPEDALDAAQLEDAANQGIPIIQLTRSKNESPLKHPYIIKWATDLSIEAALETLTSAFFQAAAVPGCIGVDWADYREAFSTGGWLTLNPASVDVHFPPQSSKSVRAAGITVSGDRSAVLQFIQNFRLDDSAVDGPIVFAGPLVKPYGETLMWWVE